jgi:hypothetical protein
MDIKSSLDLIKELKDLKKELEKIKQDFIYNLDNMSQKIYLVKANFDIRDNDNCIHDLTDSIELYIEANETRLGWLEINQPDLEELETANDEGQAISSNWTTGTELIFEDDFHNYIINSEIMNDIHIPNFIIINWNETVEGLKQDYNYIIYNNRKYYVRRT